MNKILFFISTMALVACSGGSFKNNTDLALMLDDTELSPGQCVELSAGFFGFGSDFPVTITTKDSASKVTVTDAEDKEAGHYDIQKDGVNAKVVTTETACEEDENDDSETPADTSDETEKADETEETDTSTDCWPDC